MPVALFQKWRQMKKETWKFAFFASLLCGFAAHFYRMTNWLPNWDSLVFREDPQHMTSLGRWFLSAASKCSTDYELPWLNGLLALLYLSVAAVVLIETLSVSSRVCAALIGAVTVTFPTVTSTFTYCYVADAYSLAFLLAVLAAYLFTHKKMLGAIVGVLLLTLSIGIYQAYVTVTIALLTCVLLMRLLTKTDTAVLSLKSALKYILCGISSLLLYCAVQWIVVALFHVEVLEYQNISDTFSLQTFRFFEACKESLYVFKNHFVDFDRGLNLYSLLHVGVFAVLAIGYLRVFWKSYQNPGTLALTLFYLLSIPFGCCALFFANSTIDYHNLMRMSFCIVYIYLILLYEKFGGLSAFWTTVKAWVIIGLCAAIVWNGICLANVSYHKLQIAFEKSYGILLRIADRMETTDGFASADRILVVGALPGSERYSVNFPPEVTGSTDGLILRKDDEMVRQSVLTSALQDYADISLTFMAGQEAAALRSSERVRQMPCWPVDGSIAVQDGVVIVKLSEAY